MEVAVDWGGVSNSYLQLFGNK